MDEVSDLRPLTQYLTLSSAMTHGATTFILKQMQTAICTFIHTPPMGVTRERHVGMTMMAVDGCVALETQHTA